MKKQSGDLPSMKISDLTKEPATPLPGDPRDLSPSNRAALHAYWRATCVRFVGGIVTLRLVGDYASEDVGYGTLTRAQVATALRELRDGGWNIQVEDLDQKKERPAKAAKEVKTSETPRPRTPARRLTSRLSGVGLDQPRLDLQPPNDKVEHARVPTRRTAARLRKLAGDGDELAKPVRASRRPRTTT